MKRTSRKLCAAGLGLGCALALGAPRAARAEIEIGVFGGGKFFNEQGGLGRRLAPGAPETIFNHGGIIGLRLGYLPIPRLAVEAETGVAMTRTRGAFNAMGELVEGSQQSVAVVPLRAHLLVNILTGRVRPFVLLGGGGHISTQLSPGIIQTDAVGALHAGAGLSVGIKENWGLRLDGRFILAQGPKPAADIMPAVTGPALVPEGELLLAIWGRFGGKPAPAPEAPPAAPPPPPPVDAAPPPPPPAVPPPPVVVDGDGDGVNDKDDQCPGQAGPGDNRGCPDTDKDGDGVVDRLDRCPDAAESKNGYQDEDGCPDELPKALKQFTGAIQGVGFEAGKDVLTQASFAVLDRAAQVLKDNPSVKLEIGGHTDSSGDATKNRELSQRRAEAVLKYLTDKGIAPDRLKAVGYGPDKPVADNGAPEGRSKNRRVEFTLLSGK